MNGRCQRQNRHRPRAIRALGKCAALFPVVDAIDELGEGQRLRPAMTHPQAARQKHVRRARGGGARQLSSDRPRNAAENCPRSCGQCG